jgi:hypothetical protein
MKHCHVVGTRSLLAVMGCTAVVYTTEVGFLTTKILFISWQLRLKQASPVQEGPAALWASAVQN